MGRIRSVHPGLFTDEAYMGLCLAAKAALPGLWTECDDAGVFEWKPIVLKARIFPADTVDMSSILADLEAANCVSKYDHEGKPYGVVRNFRKWQRPEKPKYRHPLPDQLRAYAGLPETDAAPPDDKSPTSTRPITSKGREQRGVSDNTKATSRQPVDDQSPKVFAEEGGRREEVGGKMEDEPSPQDFRPASLQASLRARLSEDSLEFKLRQAADWWHEAPGLGNVTPIQIQIDAGAILDLDVLPTVAAKAPAVKHPVSWGYFVSAIHDAVALRIKAQAPITQPTQHGAESDRPAATASQFAVLDGSPEMAAWESYQGKRSPRTDVVDTRDGRKRSGWYFPSQWPPGHPLHGASQTAADIPEIPRFLDRRTKAQAA